MRLRVFVALLSILQYSHGLNFLIYIPMFGRSHVNFMGKIADVLIDSGHNVVRWRLDNMFVARNVQTVLGPVIESHVGTFGTKKAKVIVVPQCEHAREYEENGRDKLVNNLWRSSSTMSFMKDISTLFQLWLKQCNTTLSHPNLFETLRNEHFDAAITEIMDHCGLGIFEHLDIKKIALVFSISTFEGSFSITGQPSFPSYVPSQMMNTSDKMTFLERVQNLLMVASARFILPYLNDPYTNLFREHYGHDFPSVEDLASKLSLLFMNAEPLIEFPRPIIHKVIDIGGISVSGGHKPLNKTWSDIFNLRKKTVLLSFGTVALSHLMPEEYKNTIRETFRKFPDVTFIWKYEKPEDEISQGIPNIIETTFVPQNDMLYDRRLSLFITHCGQGSTTESTTAGVPLIVIPVLGDQLRNSQVIKRIESGIVLDKRVLNGTNELEKAIRNVLSDNTYMEKARKIGQMIRDKPFTPQDTFVKNMEFLAKYGPLRQFDHYGKNLNFFQYYLIDVIAFIAAIVLTSVVAIILFVKRVIMCFARPVKSKTE